MPDNNKILRLLVLLIFAISLTGSPVVFAEINVYFNQSVDHSYAYPGNEAVQDQNFAQIVYDRINAAQHSIDLAVYSFDYNLSPYPLSTALINADNRGVDVRVVYHNRSIQTGMQYLISAGIPVLQRTDTGGLMHNKFYLFDARDNSSSADDWVITGSWNATISGTWDNCQNLVEIQSSELAAAYQTEFEEMWGSTYNFPSSSNARFGNDKLDNTPHYFTIDGFEVELYFSPSDNTTSHIIQQVQSANSSACFGLLVFTRSDISSALYSVYNSGASVYGIINDINVQSSEWTFLNTFAEMYHWNLGGTFHHKYAFFDYDLPSSDPVLLTGSHNWSNAAENNNDENTLIIKSADIVNLYVQEFAARIDQLGGTLPMPFTETIDDLMLEFFQYDVVLTWTEVSGASSYNVYSSDSPYEELGDWEFLGNTGDPFFVDGDGFNDGTKFYYVTVVN